MYKRAQKIQSGSPAAALIGIITLLFIFYILFLPPEERRELLEGENLSIEEAERLFLDEAPGRLTFTEKAVFDHNIPNIFLVESKNAVVLAQENPFIIRKGWLSDQRHTMIFSVQDLENTENVVLSFQAVERAGTLVISLNDNVIFEGAVRIQNPPPVVLPKSLLKSVNQLEFYVTGGFLSRRRYDLSDMKVVGDITDIKKQTATNTFTISKTERDNLESAFLDFFPICDQRTVGVLTIELNGKIVYSAVPSCESLNRQDLFAEDFRDGRNTLIFRIDKGSYRVEQVRVRTLLKPVKSYIDYFNIKSSVYNEILDRERQVILRVEFVDDRSLKHAEININDKRDVIDQRDDVYERDISSFVREGSNYIEIKPLAELDIVKLQVRAD